MNRHTPTDQATFDPKAILFPSPDVARCPYPAYQALRDGDPVHAVPGRPGEYVVSRYDDIIYVLRHPKLFSSVTYAFENGARRPATVEDVAARTPNSVATFQSSDPPAHTWKRKLASAHFRPGQVRLYEPMIRAAVDDLIDRFLPAGRVEFVSQFSRPLGAVTTLLIVGLPVEDAPRIEPWNAYDGQGSPYHDESRQAEIAAQVRDMMGYIRDAVEERHRHPRDDMLTRFVQAHVDANGAEIGLQHAVYDTFSIMLGAAGSSSHGLANTLLMFLKNSDQEQMAKLRADPALRDNAIEESLRLESPVQWNLRFVTEDVVVGGTPIEAGSFVLLAYGAANRDERHFPSPQEFVVDRKGVRQHLAFAHGLHFCLGAPYIRLQMQIAFERLFARLAEIALDGGDDAYEYVDSLAFRGIGRLDLTFETN